MNPFARIGLLFSCLLVSNSLRLHGLLRSRLPCSSLSPRACSNSCPLSQWCHPTNSSSFISFSSCLHFPPASGSFPTSWLFASGGQSIGASASASVLPVHVQSCFPLGSTGLISLVATGLSRAFSSSTVWKRQFFSAQPDPVSEVRAPLSVSLWDCQFQCQCHYSSDLGKVT